MRLELRWHCCCCLVCIQLRVLIVVHRMYVVQQLDPAVKIVYLSVSVSVSVCLCVHILLLVYSTTGVDSCTSDVRGTAA
jgi:hypothetical protein